MSDKKHRWITYSDNQTGTAQWTIDWEAWKQWQPQVYPTRDTYADHVTKEDLVRIERQMIKLEALLKELLEVFLGVKKE